MIIGFERQFQLNIALSENELHDLLLELKHLDKSECEELEKLEKEIKRAIENNKGFILVTTE